MSTNSNLPGSIIQRIFREIQTEIPFDPEWANGTGYLDGAVSYPLPPGGTAKTTDNYGRRVILIGTRFGTVAVFDRYQGQTDGGVYVSNRPQSVTIDALMTGTAIGGGEMACVLGDFGPNIGETIEEIHAELIRS